jgi:hypothetical protein
MFHNYNPARSPTADIWSPYDTNHFTALLGDPIQLAAKVVSVIAAFGNLVSQAGHSASR